MIDVEAIIARELDGMLPLAAVTPDWADVERRARYSAGSAPKAPLHGTLTRAPRRLLVNRRTVLALAGAVVLVGALLAVAVFPRSPNTSSGLSAISNRGTHVPFVPADKGWGTAYVLAELGGFVYFRVEKPEGFVVPPGITNRPTCYGQGRLRGGRVEVLGVDCSAFPSARTPVLKWVNIDASDRAGRGKLLSVDGVAADGVAEMRLVSTSGDVIARTPVEANVYRFKDVSGLAASGVKLVAVDADGHEVWSGPGAL